MPTPKALPSMQAVADLARVHRTTVSLALRGHPRIPEETRERVRAAAEKIGYQINPLVSALMQARRRMKPPKNLTSIGYLSAWPTRNGWRAPENPLPDFFPGASARAAELGFKLEHFWLTEPGMTSARMTKILLTRGITGLIVGRLPPQVRSLELQWQHFATVSIGVSLESPRVSHVASSHFHVGKLAYQVGVSRGYRRIGLVLPHQKFYRRVQEQHVGAYFAEQYTRKDTVHLPPLITEEPDEVAIMKWINKNRPDLILCSNAGLMKEVIERGRWKVPRDIGVAGLSVEEPDGRVAGVWSDPAIIGGMAVELVVGLLHRNEIGLPEHEQEILYQPSWIEGATVRPPQRES